MTDDEKERILGALNYKDENDKERKQNDTWVYTFLTLFSMVNAPNPNLEKEIAYIKGQVDTLEKIVLKREAENEK